jgi:hypothetical protein
MSGSDSSPAPTPAEPAAQQVEASLTKDIAESLQFTGQEVSLKKRKRRANRAIGLTKELGEARKQPGTLNHTHNVDVARHHLVACAVKMAKFTEYGSEC